MSDYPVLSDTPGRRDTDLAPSALGTAGQRVRVNAGADAPEWADPDLVCTAAELATTYAPSAVLRGVVAYTSDTLATYVCRRTAASTYSWAQVGGGHPTPLLLTSLNATVSDATPGTDGSAAIDADGVITLSTENALAFSFNNGPKISKAFTLDGGSRFRARVRLVSKSGPSSDTIVGLYYGGGLAVFARISGQIGVWDLNAGVPAASVLSALWDGSEYLELRVSDGLVQYGIWQGTTFTPFYAAVWSAQASGVGVVMSSVPAGATQTVVLDDFTVTDLRAW